MKYRRKSEVIEAFQLTNDWFDLPHPNPQHVIGFRTDPVARTVTMPTVEGTMTAKVGDWIVEDARGYYPCGSDYFETTYEPVSGSEQGSMNRTEATSVLGILIEAGDGCPVRVAKLLRLFAQSFPAFKLEADVLVLVLEEALRTRYDTDSSLEEYGLE